MTFSDPKEERDPAREDIGGLTEPSVGDLETWLVFQAGHLGTPTWWEELGAMPGIEDRHKFAQKIGASFYVPEVWLRVSPEWGYTVPLERLAYQDVRQQPTLLTIVYARCLQYWAEKHNPPKNPDFCPLAESVRELQQTV